MALKADHDQDERERQDIAFENGEQWPAQIKLQRQGQQPINGMPAVPARPTLVIDKLKAPIRQVLNAERQSDIGIELVPADDFGDLGIVPDETEIALREGLIRRIQRDSSAADARTWAYKRSVIAGRGYYQVLTRFLPGKSFDQEVYVARIYEQSSVKLDPTHEQPDGSDADWAFVGSWMPWDKFKAMYPKDADGKASPFGDMSNSDFMTLPEQYPEWYQGDETNKAANAVRITDYWYKEHTPREVALLPDGTSVWLDEVADGVEPIETREVIETTVKFCKIAGGVMRLEETDWPSPYIPIIKVIGDEVLPYDQNRRYEGMVRSARDAQQAENYMISRFVEVVGLAPLSSIIVEPDAIEGYETWWQQANTRALPYLPARSYDDQGRPLKEPHRPATDPNILPMAQGIQLFDAFIKDTTSVPNPTLGNVDPSLKSGRAIREVVANAALSTSNFLDNLTRSMRYEGQIINSLLYPIYGTRPGRLVRVMTGEGQSEMQRVEDPSQGMGAMPPGMPPGMPPQVMPPTPPLSMRQKAEKVAKLTEDAKFNILVKLAKSTENRRQQFVEMFGNLLAADPQQMAVAGDLFYKNMDIPEAKALSERQRVMLAPPIQQMLAQKDQGRPFDPAAQAQMAHMQQQMQQMDGMLKELSRKAADNDAKLALERMVTQKDIELQRMKNATSLAVAHINAEARGIQQLHRSEDEAVALAVQQMHDAGEAQRDRDHEQDLAMQGRAHEAALMPEAAQETPETPNVG
jgi:hypothetical protein